MSAMKLVLGTMTFGESVFAPDVARFVEAFLDAGFDELDTAYVYNEGNCERLLGEALAGLGSKPSVVVVPAEEGHLVQPLFPHLKNTKRFEMRPRVRVRAFW